MRHPSLGRWLLRGPGTSALRNLVTKSIGGQNVAQAPPSKEAPPGLYIENSVQPGFITNQLGEGQLNVGVVNAPNSEPLSVHNADQSQGRSTLVTIMGYDNFPSVSMSGSSTAHLEIAFDMPSLSGIYPYGKVIGANLSLFNDTGYSTPILTASEWPGAGYITASVTLSYRATPAISGLTARDAKWLLGSWTAPTAYDHGSQVTEVAGSDMNTLGTPARYPAAEVIPIGPIQSAWNPSTKTPFFEVAVSATNWTTTSQTRPALYAQFTCTMEVWQEDIFPEDPPYQDWAVWQALS